jgi:hypothetical protein
MIALALIVASTAAHPFFWQAPNALRILAIGGLPLAILLPVVWMHPCRPQMQSQLLSIFEKRSAGR